MARTLGVLFTLSALCVTVGVLIGLSLPRKGEK
jgi:hypothetical protein